MACLERDLIFWIVLFAWRGLGAAFKPSFIFSLYWEKTERRGVLAGMITGTLIVIGWKLFLAEKTGLYELIPAFSCSSFVIIAFGLCQKQD